jgi:DNA-binding NarL/FixJ family response regulator
MPAAPPSERALRILIADDHKLFAESLMNALGEDDRIDVIGIAANGQQAVETALELRPDVILMDLMMPVLDGFDATRRLREAGSDARILILMGTDGGIGSENALAAGASGFIRKEQSLIELKHVLFEAAVLAALLGSSRQ